MLLVVQTADCIPDPLADTKNRAVAAIHSGWRGTLRRIAEKTLGRMRMEFGTRPEDVIAALGPGIGRCCYEVGSDVAKEFHAQFPEAREWFDGPFDALAAGENDPNWLPWLTMRPPGHAPPPPTRASRFDRRESRDSGGRGRAGGANIFLGFLHRLPHAIFFSVIGASAPPAA